jgi:RNA polymerase sigma-70 factor, ECF subfamily
LRRHEELDPIVNPVVGMEIRRPGCYRSQGSTVQISENRSPGALDHGDELLRRCQAGDESALRALVRGYQERIFRLAWRILGDANLADDATARVLEKIWSKAGQWQGRSSASTWIYRVAYRTILDVQRSRQRRWRWKLWPTPAPPLVDRRPGPAVKVEQEEAAARVQKALAELVPADRALVHLYYFENQGLAEIEAVLSVNRDALKMRLARARERLRKLLEGDHG